MSDTDSYSKGDVPYFAHPAFIIVMMVNLCWMWTGAMIFEPDFRPYIIDILVGLGAGLLCSPMVARALVENAAEISAMCRHRSELRLLATISNPLTYGKSGAKIYGLSILSLFGSLTGAVIIIMTLYHLMPGLGSPWARFAMVKGDTGRLLFGSIPCVLFTYLLVLHAICLQHIRQWYKSLPDNN